MTDDRALLMIAASETDSNLYYATRFIAPDPFVYLEIKGERLMVMSDLEMDRGRRQAAVDRVVSYSEVERAARAQGVSDPGTIDIVHGILQPAGIKKVLVPANFSYAHALRLQQLGYQLELKTGPLFPARAVKTVEEVYYVEAAQRATERAVAAAHAALRTAEIRNGLIWL